MNKLITVILALMLLGSVVMAQNTDTEKKQRPKGQRQGQQMERMVFGISQTEYEKLNLTDDQKTKAEALQKAYNEKYMKAPAKKDEAKATEKPTQPSQEEMAKQMKEREEASKKLNSDFKAILTADQIKIYDAAQKAKLEKQKDMLTKQMEQMDKMLTFNSTQKSLIKDMIKDYDGNITAFNTDFMQMLTADQKTIYQNNMKNGMRGGQGGPGMGQGRKQRPGNGQEQNGEGKKPRRNHDQQSTETE